MLWYWQNKQNSFAPLPKKLTQLKYFLPPLVREKLVTKHLLIATLCKGGADINPPYPPYQGGGIG